MKDVIYANELFAFVENEIIISYEEGRNGRAQNLKSVRNSFRTFLRSSYLPFPEFTSELIIGYERRHGRFVGDDDPHLSLFPGGFHDRYHKREDNQSCKGKAKEENIEMKTRPSVVRIAPK